MFLTTYDSHLGEHGENYGCLPTPPNPEFNRIVLSVPLPQVVLMRSRVLSAVLHEQMELVWAGKVFPCFLVLHLVWNPLLQLHTYLTVPSRLPVFIGAWFSGGNTRLCLLLVGQISFLPTRVLPL